MTQNPYVLIWFRPREAVRELGRGGSNRAVLALAALIGVSVTLGRVPFLGPGHDQSGASLFRLTLYGGALVGVVRLWMHARLTLWLAMALGGVAPPERIRAAIAWGGAPNVLELLVQGSILAVWPEVMFSPATMSDASALPLLALTGVSLVTGVWRLALVGVGVDEVCGLTAARGLLAATVSDATVLLLRIFVSRWFLGG